MTLWITDICFFWSHLSPPLARLHVDFCGVDGTSLESRQKTAHPTAFRVWCDVLTVVQLSLSLNTQLLHHQFKCETIKRHHRLLRRRVRFSGGSETRRRRFRGKHLSRVRNDVVIWLTLTELNEKKEKWNKKRKKWNRREYMACLSRSPSPSFSAW